MCVLRASGVSFDVDSFLESSELSPCRIFRRGEPRLIRPRPVGVTLETSGINVAVSDAEWRDLAAQIADTERFLREHAGEIRRLVRFPGVEDVTLDFPIDLRIDSEVATQSERFPASLVAAAGNLGLGLELSIYPKPEDE